MLNPAAYLQDRLQIIEDSEVIVSQLPEILSDRFAAQLHGYQPSFYRCQKDSISMNNGVLTFITVTGENVSIDDASGFHIAPAKPVRTADLRKAQECLVAHLDRLLAFAEEQGSEGLLLGYDPMDDGLPQLSKDEALKLVDWSNVTDISYSDDNVHVHTCEGMLTFWPNVDWYNILS